MSEQKNNTLILKIKNKQSLLTLLGVLFFAIQSLYFVIHYKINFPYSMDNLATKYLFNYFEYGEFPIEQLFQPHAGHHLIFPRLVALPNLILNSFDVGNFFIYQWVFFSITLFLIYLLLKKTDTRLIWLLIPISAFVYSPLQSSNYWAFAIWLWLIPPICIIAIIYFLNKEKINSKIMAVSITLAIVSTFSSIIGTVVWIPGLIMLLRKKHSKKWFFIWLISVIIVGIIYYTSVPQSEVKTTPELLFTSEGYSFIATFTAVAFRLKYDILMDIVGTFSIILSGILAWYFVKIKKNQSVFPWFMFILIGIISGIITSMGRIHLDFHIGNEPYYIPISHFTQIGLIVIISMVILDLNKQKRNQKIISYLLFLIIIGFSIMIIPSYIAGWSRGEIYFDEKKEFLECFTLSSNIKCIKENGVFNKDLNFDNINYLLENKWSIFGEKEFNQTYFNDLSQFHSKIKNTELDSVKGKIEFINGQNMEKHKQFDILEPITTIEGSISSKNNEQIEQIYLLLNSEPFLKSTEFSVTDTESNSKFLMSFLSGYVPKGCHDLSIIGIIDDQILRIEDVYQVCK